MILVWLLAFLFATCAWLRVERKTVVGLHDDRGLILPCPSLKCGRYPTGFI